MKNKITDVRNLTIEAMERLLNPEIGDSFGVAEANAMANLANAAVKSAMAEVKYLQVMQKMGIESPGTGFLGTEDKKSIGA